MGREVKSWVEKDTSISQAMAEPSSKTQVSFPQDSSLKTLRWKKSRYEAIYEKKEKKKDPVQWTDIFQINSPYKNKKKENSDQLYSVLSISPFLC